MTPANRARSVTRLYSVICGMFTRQANMVCARDARDAVRVANVTPEMVVAVEVVATGEVVAPELWA